MVDNSKSSSARKSRKTKTPTDLLRTAAAGTSSASPTTTSAVFRRILVQKSDKYGQQQRQESETEEVFDVVSVASDTPSAISISSDASSAEIQIGKNINSKMGNKRRMRPNGAIVTQDTPPKATSMPASKSKRKGRVPAEYLEMVDQVVGEDLNDNSETDSSNSKHRRSGKKFHSYDSSEPVTKRPRQGHGWDGTGKGKGRLNNVIDLDSDNSTADSKSRSTYIMGNDSAHAYLPPGNEIIESDDFGTTALAQSDNFTGESGEDEDDEDEWENVEIGTTRPAVLDTVAPVSDNAPEEERSVEFTLGESKPVKIARKKATITREDREFRLTVHMFHLLCLICHGSIRSKWCSDVSVKESLKKYVPNSIEEELHPDESLPPSQRTRKFLDGLRHLMDFWNRRFHVTHAGMRRRQWDEIDTMKKETNQQPPLDLPEFRRTLNGLQGSRDVGAQGFCALLRAFHIRTRLVFSMQPLPFTFSAKSVSKPSRVSQAIVLANEDEKNANSLDEQQPTVPKRAPIRLRKPRFSTASSSTMSYTMADHTAIKLEEVPYPVFWVEVWDEAGLQWVSIDPMVLKLVEIPKYRSKFEPPASETANVLSYVLAFDQAGHAKDVTRRYAHQYNSKTRKLRITNEPIWQIWFDRVILLFQTKYVTQIDQLEDASLAKKEASEDLPTNIQDFKGHPVFVLERHLRQNEIIHPKVPCGTVAVGRSKNSETEPIYRRRDVQSLRSAPQWYKLGRIVKVGEQAMKHIKRRSAKTRGGLSSDIEDEDDDGDDDVALYADYQTDLYVPPPVINGKIPKNDYGNLDVFVPSMVPKGAIHLPLRGIANAVKVLGIDYADAVSGFDFAARKATPRIEGVVVAEEYAESVMAVYNAQQEQMMFEEDQRRQEEAMKRWRKYLIALRIRERIAANPAFQQLEENESSARQIAGEVEQTLEEDEGGRFVVEDQVMNDEQDRRPAGVVDDGEDESGGFVVDSMSDEPVLPASSADDEEEYGGGFVVDDSSISTSGKPFRSVESNDVGEKAGGFLVDDEDDDVYESAAELEG
ncbi:hypothetical protein V1512DRAFT_258233 [Lipomyces arxii]|uniref:uncharacterized protein n=1 Tax=Lipomyces arxii TaxID=56418 RepID=UPI0034CF3CEF